MGRRLSLLAGMIALACALMLPASASAAQRFGSPGASGPNPCNPDACSLTDAVNNASVGDEVIVAPGDYDIGEGNLLLDVANLKVHGVEGQPRPVIRGEPAASPLMNITATGAGAIVRHLSLRQDGTGGANGVSVTLNADALSTSSDLLLTNTRIGGTAARLGSAATLASSTARAPDGAGVTAFGAPGPTLHNVTAWGGTTGIAAELFAAAVATNTIARAPGGTDLSAGLGASITMANSNFDSTSGSIASLAGNQSDAPVLADPTNGDFHQRKGSRTIDAGQLDPLAGLTDFDGNARVLGGVQDIGADEYVPRPPTVATGDPVAITTSGGRLSGTVNPNGLNTTYHFDYGLTPAYGSSTAAQGAGAGVNDVPVTADLGDLAPGTIVNYRLVANNADGEAVGGNRTLVVLPAQTPTPPETAPITQVLPPVNLGGARGPGPALSDIQLPQTIVVGQPIVIQAEGRDPDDPVNSIVIDFDDGPGIFAASACRLSPRSRLFNNNRSTDFEVPYTFATPGTHTVEVTLGSGDCKRARQTRTQTVQVNVAPAKTRAQRKQAHRAAVTTASHCRDADTVPTGRNNKAIEKATVCLLNEQRRGGGLKSLRTNKRLRKAAALHNTYMKRGKFFAHQGPGEPGLAARLRKAKYRGGAGENLAAANGPPLSTPRGIVIGWMGSPVHRANVMEKAFYTVGIHVMAEMPLEPYLPGATYTGEFGTTRR